MRKLTLGIISATLVTSSVQAAEWRTQAVDVRPGAFIGARVRVPLGANGPDHARAMLTIAPTQSRFYQDGMVRTGIGEGISLNFGTGGKPSLTLAGVRADQALGLTTRSTETAEQELGMSDGAKVAVGVVVALVLVAGGTYAYLSSRCTECDQ